MGPNKIAKKNVTPGNPDAVNVEGFLSDIEVQSMRTRALQM